MSSIKELLTEGNDEQIIHLVCALLDVGQNKEKCAELLVQLGTRYLYLAICREGIGEGIEEVQERLKNGSLFLPSQRDETAVSWYEEAWAAFSAAGATPDRSMALRELARALHGGLS